MTAVWFALLALPSVAVFAGWFAVRRYCAVSKFPRVEPEDAPHQSAHLRLYDPWAEHWGFEWLGMFREGEEGGHLMGIWRHSARPLYMAVHLRGREARYEFVSLFRNRCQLRTTSDPSSWRPVRPGCFRQLFVGQGPEALFKAHRRAHDHLVNRQLAEVVPTRRGYQESCIEERKEDTKWLTSIALWPLRAVHWYSVAPRLNAGRNVADA